MIIPAINIIPANPIKSGGSGGESFSGMITEWTVTAGQTITLRGQSGAAATYLYDVDWGDNSTETGITISNKTHTYTDAGTYTVKISGQFAGWKMSSASATDRTSLTNFVSKCFAIAQILDSCCIPASIK